MARPKGSRNKLKLVVPTADGGTTVDHNTIRPGELTDDQRAALFFAHQRQYESALDAKKAADAALKQVCKVIKAEGSKLDEIKLAMLDPEILDAKIRAEVERSQRLSRWLGMPVGSQLSLLDDVDRTPSTDKAHADGKRAGLAGKDASPPFAAHLPQASDWLAGWHEGQAVVAAGFKQKPADEDFDDLGPVEKLPPTAASVLDDMAKEYADNDVPAFLRTDEKAPDFMSDEATR